MNSNSILSSTKKILNIADDDLSFDLDIIMFINSTLATLHQLGVGPEEGFMIEDATAEWATLLGGDPRQNGVKNFVYLSVRLAFDPPATSFAISAIEKQIEEMGWRINVQRERFIYVSPTPVIEEDVYVLDGGSP